MDQSLLGEKFIQKNLFKHSALFWTLAIKDY